MSATPIPDGEDPFVPEGNVEILIDSEGVWFRAADVIALLERASYDAALKQLRQVLDGLGGEQP